MRGKKKDPLQRIASERVLSNGNLSGSPESLPKEFHPLG